MSLEESRRSQRPYRYGMVLLCVGALINWLGLAENYVEPVRYVGVACIVAGALLICAAMCCWLHAPPTRASVQAQQTSHPITAQIDDPIHVISIEEPSITNPRQKPPDYEAVADAPPSYDDAIKLNPAQLALPSNSNDLTGTCTLPSTTQPVVVAILNPVGSGGLASVEPTAPSPPPPYARDNGAANVDSDITIVSTPVPKRQKIDINLTNGSNDLDRSIVVLNDTIASTVSEIGSADVEANEVVEVNSPAAKTPKFKKMRRRSRTASVTPIKNVFAAKRVNKTRRKREIEVKNKKVSKKAVCRPSTNDENRSGQIMDNSSGGADYADEIAAGEAEDIEVIWVSNDTPTLTRQETSTERPFVIDTEPTLENLTKIVSARTKKVKRLEARVKQMRLQVNNQRAQNSNFRPSRKSRFAPDGQARSVEHKERLREIVIDGCNVGMGHKPGSGFSEKALQIVIDYFKERGHVVKAFLPQNMRARNRALLEKLHVSGHVVFTPSRKIGGKKITPYDDRFILEYATKCGGIVVSSDQYRDLWHEKPQWRDTIENRLLTPTFVGDYLMFPEDPLGRTGPKLEQFLRH